MLYLKSLNIKKRFSAENLVINLVINKYCMETKNNTYNIDVVLTRSPEYLEFSKIAKFITDNKIYQINYKLSGITKYHKMILSHFNIL